MHTKITIIVLLSILVCICIGLFLTVFTSPAEVPIVNEGQTFPESPEYTPTPIAEGKKKIFLQNGEESTVLDFINNGETVPDVVNTGQYVLAGTLGYCLGDGTCPSGAAVTNFQITFEEKYQLFNILLLEEPLSQSRRDAEQFLLERLGIDTETMCTLQYSVAVTSRVSEVYAGQNLGFSFCPNSVVLP